MVLAVEESLVRAVGEVRHADINVTQELVGTSTGVCSMLLQYLWEDMHEFRMEQKIDDFGGFVAYQFA